MRRHAKVVLVAASFVTMAGHAEARNFFEQAARDIGNGAKHVFNEVGKVVRDAPNKRSPDRMNPCGASGGNACMKN